MAKLDLTVVILTKDEHIHLPRCLEMLAPLGAKQIVVVDSLSQDDTCEIARQHGAKVIAHAWPGAQSTQYNWYVDEYERKENSVVERTAWTLRLDADEYLMPELIAELLDRLPDVPEDVAGIVLKRRHIFFGRWVRFGTYPVRILRLYRTGHARYDDNMVMDEHLRIDTGRTIEFERDFVDHSLISFAEWKDKHRGYARREARMVLSGVVNRNKRWYYRLPPYVRPLFYFFVRYFVRLGFLNGIAGFKWDFYQGLWYRWMIDGEIRRLLRIQAKRPKTMGVVNLARYRNQHGSKNKLIRLIWSIVWIFAARWMPRFMFNRWRAFVLRCFGAKIGRHCRLTSSMEVWMPSRLFMGNQVWIDKGVNLYNVERITIGDNAIISDGAYICTATHDITKRDFPLVTAPVTIGPSAWIAAHAIVLPGMTIGEGAVVAAGAVVVKDVEPWTVVGGNPARVIKKREIL